jgi:hypothetical protein
MAPPWTTWRDPAIFDRLEALIAAGYEDTPQYALVPDPNCPNRESLVRVISAEQEAAAMEDFKRKKRDGLWPPRARTLRLTVPDDSSLANQPRPAIRLEKGATA